MKLIEVKELNTVLTKQLFEVWDKSVRETHLFLSDSEIIDISRYIPQALSSIAHLIVAFNDENNPVAFMGIEDRKLEMLFVSPGYRGKGLGKQLIHYGIDNYSINELGVNEQNPQAKAFYEHMGFQVYKRTDTDEQGNPYPILYMRLV
ncbi:GNAT family N-acetyltransferase [Lacrimispora defluvii]|uniref:GNAT family N-acetyltransferase n=1 Tax=Lacrimispora defluvii TaxID=2719233 RepID=A0ABX1VT08_9FIRM|nr:GNAT family N-acetyltransferase [Lacrimispora defluvii]NNJ30545.1 GNAT family N-acetyltransferase [Lacrimispora defluvii]